MMPRIVVERFVIRVFTDDHAPAHVHVFRDGAELRVYLRGSRPADNIHGRMKASDRRRAIELVAEHRPQLLALWRRYHS
jgi:hypothetical protein